MDPEWEKRDRMWHRTSVHLARIEQIQIGWWTGLCIVRKRTRSNEEAVGTGEVTEAAELAVCGVRGIPQLDTRSELEKPGDIMRLQAAPKSVILRRLRQTGIRLDKNALISASALQRADGTGLARQMSS